MIGTRSLFLLSLPLLFSFSFAQNQDATDDSSFPAKIGLAGGLGVSYVNAVDIVNRINGSYQPPDRVADFNSAVEFYGAVTVPINSDWVAKLEYAYLLSSYNVNLPGSEFSVSAHMPTLIAQYVLVYRETYNVKGGFGLGYHFGNYTEHYYTADATYSGSGLGAKIDIEANTAFGESLFAYLGGDLRWEFIGDLTSPQESANVGPIPTLNFFSIGAKLGFTYYF